jgi:hypothetical protein
MPFSLSCVVYNTTTTWTTSLYMNSQKRSYRSAYAKMDDCFFVLQRERLWTDDSYSTRLYISRPSFIDWQQQQQQQCHMRKRPTQNITKCGASKENRERIWNLVKRVERVRHHGGNHWRWLAFAIRSRRLTLVRLLCWHRNRSVRHRRPIHAQLFIRRPWCDDPFALCVSVDKEFWRLILGGRKSNLLTLW